MANIDILDIGEVAHLTGTSASALRYYEELGLIQSIGRRGLRRIFDGNVVNQLALIELGRSAGFTLQEILEMGIANDDFGVDRDKVSQKAEELEVQMKRLADLTALLRHVAHCPADDHFSCGNFQKLLRIARKRKRLQLTRGNS
ncbi:MerR family DNA-binding transcriptional regulator [Hoeflea sp. TYP-13]|uniref:MerR family DNA-binding transcriptional regulator n=1 Tax=Hoeflea sp. TYP-13 TaxID=3230023 RepID=UPI0034C65F37